MSDAISIFPFDNVEGLVRFGFQTAIFLVGLYLAHKLLIKPSLLLQEERKKRTVGNSQSAFLNEEKAKELEHTYFMRLKEGADAVHKMHAEQILEAQKLSLVLITDSQQKANEYVKSVRDKLEGETTQAKEHLMAQLEQVITTIHKKIGIVSILFIIATLSFLSHSVVYAASPAQPLISSIWYSVFWPYFQFALFLVAVVYFGRKPIRELLEKRRDDFRSKLSEAHEAVYLADKKVKEYEAKVASLESELKALRDRNLEDARLEKERILKEAAKTSDIILKDAQRTAAELINSSKDEIRKELFLLAIAEVEKRMTSEKLASLDNKFKQEALENIRDLN